MKRKTIFFILGLSLIFTCPGTAGAEEKQEVSVAVQAEDAESQETKDEVLEFDDADVEDAAESGDVEESDELENADDFEAVEDLEDVDESETVDEAEGTDESEITEDLEDADEFDFTDDFEENAEDEKTDLNNKKSVSNAQFQAKPARAPFQTGVLEYDNLFLLAGGCFLGLGGLFVYLKKHMG